MPRFSEWVRPGANLDGVDNRLLALIEAAADASPYGVQITSAHNARASGTPWHPNGIALDVQLYKDGKPLPNFQSIENFAPYEEFAQSVRGLQQDRYPELDSQLRWGGYFGGPLRNPFNRLGYAVDSMHFDLGPTSAMAGGSWEGGLTPTQRALMPGVKSVGMKERRAMAEKAKTQGGLSDDDIEGLLSGRIAPASAAPATSAQAQPASSAQPGMTDAEIEGLLAGRAPSQPVPGRLAGEPQTVRQASAVDNSGSVAVGRGLIDGIPVVGPALLGGVERAAAGVRSWQRGRPYADELAAVRREGEQLARENPKATSAGHFGGAVVGLAPAVAAAPAAFGISGAPVLTRMGISAGTNALIGGADAAVRSGGDLTATGIGAGIGGGAGFGAPLAGKAIGAGVNKLTPYLQGFGDMPAVQNVNRLLEASGMSPPQALDSLKRMGPSATLADLDPALTTEAGALAARGGKSTSILKNAMSDRAAGANDRVARSFDDLLGRKPDMTAEIAAIEGRAREAASPFYKMAYENRAGHDLGPILTGIDARLNTATGGTADVLNRIRGYLVTKDGLPKVATNAVHEARQAIDDLIERLPSAETSAGKNARAALNDVRGQIDAELKRNPTMRAGDAAFAGEMKVRGAMQEGAELFSRKVRPEDFFRRVVEASPAELDALRAGARVAIGDALEQASRGELSAARQMFGAASANRAKLTQLFPNAGKALDMLQTEAAMRATEARVAANSATAERAAAGKRYSPEGAGSTLSNDLLAAAAGAALGDPTGGLGTAAARRAGGNILTRITGSRYDRLAEATAERLAASGDRRDAFMRELIARGASRNRLLGDQAATGANLLLDAVGTTYGRRRALEAR